MNKSFTVYFIDSATQPLIIKASCVSFIGGVASFWDKEYGRDDVLIEAFASGIWYKVTQNTYTKKS